MVVLISSKLLIIIYGGVDRTKLLSDFATEVHKMTLAIFENYEL